MKRKILAGVVVLMYVMVIVVPLTTITTVNAEDWMDKLGRVLFGRHEDAWDYYTGKITEDEFNQREKVRQTTWKALPLAISPVTIHPYVGTTPWDIHKILKDSSEDTTSLKRNNFGGVDFTSIHLNYIAMIDNSNFSYISFLMKATEAEKDVFITDLGDATEQSLNSFFIGLIIPDNLFWVNLNPWESNRIIDEDLGKTDMGKIMLEADFQMKKDFCKYEDPCTSEIGETYWELLDKKQEDLVNDCIEKYPGQIKDAKNVLFQAATRYWIVPDKVDVYGNDNEIYIVNSRLNIYSESVYNHSTFKIENQNPSLISKECLECLDDSVKEYGRYATELEEEMVLPLVVQDINNDNNYSDLRQVYVSLALAQWYKEQTKDTGMFSDLIDSRNFTGLESKSTWNAEDIWRDYKKSFEEGGYHCWKNETRKETYREGDYIVTKTITSTELYSSGGVDFSDVKKCIAVVDDLDINKLTSQSNEYFFFWDLYLLCPGSGDGKPPTDKKPTPAGDVKREEGHMHPPHDTPTPSPGAQTPAFEAILVIAGLIAVAYLLRRGR